MSSLICLWVTVKAPFSAFVEQIRYQYPNLTAVRLILFVAILQIFICGKNVVAQDLKPGLPGMAPVKWITIKNTQAPGRVYQSLSSNARTYTQEDTYIKAWIPVVIKSRFALAIAPHYRSEQMELKRATSEVADPLSSWRLRAIGVDMKSFVRLDSSSWLINTANVSQSGNINDGRASRIPLTYTFSSTYLRRKSPNTEIGFGLMVSKANSLMILPVFVYNHNFSSKQGLEISLPHKIAWRYNLTATDILFLKGEANTRTYFINNPTGDNFDLFRRIDVDMGVAYNKQFTRFMGAELFAGYRQNLSSQVPENVIAVKNSGWVASFEIYIRSPQGLHFNKRRP